MNKNVIAKRIEEFGRRSGLNSNLINMRPHPYKDKTLIFTLNNANLLDLDRKIDLLKDCLQGEVFEFNFGPDTDLSEISYRPWEESSK